MDRVIIEPGEGKTIWLGGVGVVFKAGGDETRNALAVVEHPVLPGTLVPPHIHHSEDELSYVLEGVFGVKVGDRVFEAGPGSYIFKPRDVPHAFWNAGQATARLIELIYPAGFEHFFEELAAAYEAGAGVPDAKRINELAVLYDTEFVMDWAPALEAQYGVSLIHHGGQ